MNRRRFLSLLGLGAAGAGLAVVAERVEPTPAPTVPEPVHPPSSLAFETNLETFTTSASANQWSSKGGGDILADIRAATERLRGFDLPRDYAKLEAAADWHRFQGFRLPRHIAYGLTIVHLSGEHDSRADEYVEPDGTTTRLG